MRKTVVIILTVVFGVLTLALLFQGNRVNSLKKEADAAKTIEISKVEDRYKDSIKFSRIRENVWRSKYDSLASVKKVVNVAIKLNKKQSDEKIYHINSANDSILHVIEDSTLRANGYRK